MTISGDGSPWEPSVVLNGGFGGYHRTEMLIRTNTLEPVAHVKEEQRARPYPRTHARREITWITPPSTLGVT